MYCNELFQFIAAGFLLASVLAATEARYINNEKATDFEVEYEASPSNDGVVPAVFVGDDGIPRLLRDADGEVVAVPVDDHDDADDVIVSREKRSAGGFHHPVHIFKKRNNFTYTAHHFYKVPYGHHGRK